MLERGALHVDVRILRASGFQLRLRLGHIHGGSDAAVVAALRQLERFLVGHDGRVEESLLRIEAPQLEVVERQFRVKAQIHARQIGGACLRFGARGFHRPPHAAPHIGFVGNVNGQLKIVVGNR